VDENQNGYFQSNIANPEDSCNNKYQSASYENSELNENHKVEPLYQTVKPNKNVALNLNFDKINNRTIGS
jgi:hypothetical protein